MCKHTYIRTEETYFGMIDVLYVCSKCGNRCEPAIYEKRKKEGVKFK